MGIWAIISGEFGDLQGKILLTTLTVVGTSVLGLACGAFLDSPRSQTSMFKAVPVAGIALAALSALMSFWMIWGYSGGQFDGALKTFLVSLIFAFSLAQLSLLSLAQLAKRFQWSLTTAYVVILLLDSIISTIIIFELSGDDGLVFRIIGILSVTAAALTVMIPIFRRLSRTEFVDVEVPSVAGIDAEIAQLKSVISHLEKQKEDILNAENRN